MPPSPLSWRRCISHGQVGAGELGSSRCIFVGGVHPGCSSCKCQRSREMIRVRSATRVLAVIDQQPQLAFDTVKAGHRQIRLT
jgi:hypothetical protein